MANLPETSNFDEGVYQIEQTDPVIGGPDGVTNKPTKNLVNRTRYLKDKTDELERLKAPLESPTFTGEPRAPTPETGDQTTKLATTLFVKRQIIADQYNLPAATGSTLGGVKIGANITNNGGKISVSDHAFLKNYTFDRNGGKNGGAMYENAVTTCEGTGYTYMPYGDENTYYAGNMLKIAGTEGTNRATYIYVDWDNLKGVYIGTNWNGMKWRALAWLDNIHPVGSIYISCNSTSPASIFGGGWTQIAAGRVLQGIKTGQYAGQEISAGLPNITGTIDLESHVSAPTGAFRARNTSDDGGFLGGTHQPDGVAFDASRSSSIYGASNTVQPPAYVVYMWRRIS